MTTDARVTAVRVDDGGAGCITLTPLDGDRPAFVMHFAAAPPWVKAELDGQFVTLTPDGLRYGEQLLSLPVVDAAEITFLPHDRLHGFPPPAPAVSPETADGPVSGDTADAPVVLDGLPEWTSPVYELGLDLTALAADQAEWSQATFGRDAERGPVGALRHLAKEAAEAEAAYRAMTDAVLRGDAADAKDKAASAFAEELADCLLLLLDANRRAGHTPHDLVRAAMRKMPINRGRRWDKPTSDAPAEHVRD